MILIIGSNHDDVLYFENLIKDPSEEVVLKKYHVLKGSIANQEVIILQDVYTSMVSSMLTSYLITKYLVMMVFVVGRCSALTPNLTYGDVVVCDQALFSDVDLVAKAKGNRLGQIPGYESFFRPSLRLLHNMNSALDAIVGTHYDAAFFSSSFFRLNKEIINDEAVKHLTSVSTYCVLDGETSGVALACHEHDVPFISVKVVESLVGEYTSLENYIMVLERFALVGKAVALCIEQIHRTDVIREGR